MSDFVRIGKDLLICTHQPAALEPPATTCFFPVPKRLGTCPDGLHGTDARGVLLPLVLLERNFMASKGHLTGTMPNTEEMPKNNPNSIKDTRLLSRQETPNSVVGGIGKRTQYLWSIRVRAHVRAHT